MAFLAPKDSGAFEKRASGLRYYVVFLGKTLYSQMPLFTQVYKWVPANLINAGGNPAMD